MDDTAAATHIIARRYPTEGAARRKWEQLHRRLRGCSSHYRLCWRGDWLVVVVADDEQARVEAMSALDGGQAVTLPAEVADQLRARRRAQAPREPGRRRVRRGSLLAASGANDAAAPVMGCALANEADARALYARLVEELLPAFEGAFFVFAEGVEWVVAAVCDDPASARTAAAALTQHGGILDYEPSEARLAELLALRAEAGQAPFPVSMEGEARVGEPLTSAAVERTAVHPPTRRQPCVCGSGRRYKNCCGRGR